MSKTYCGAKTKTNGKCKQPAMTNGKCRLHGGKTPRGIANANTKHGRYSKDLPTRLAGRFEDAINDEELGTLKSEIALLDTRIGELLGGLDTEQTISAWQDVANARDAISAAMRSGKGNQLMDAFNYLDNVVNNANSEFEIWNNIVFLIDQRRKLTDSERKRMVDLQQMITAEQSMLLVTTLMRAVKTHVTDRHTLSAIANEIRAVTG
jgi:uncharacterized protein YjcR